MTDIYTFIFHFSLKSHKEHSHFFQCEAKTFLWAKVLIRVIELSFLHKPYPQCIFCAFQLVSLGLTKDCRGSFSLKKKNPL